MSDIEWEETHVRKLTGVSIDRSYYALLTPKQVRAVFDLVKFIEGYSERGDVYGMIEIEKLHDILNRLDMNEEDYSDILE